MKSNEQAYLNAKEILKNQEFAKKRLGKLLRLIVFFIDKIQIKLPDLEIDDDDLDKYLMRLSRLLETKSKVLKDLKLLEKSSKSGSKSAGELARS